ncbi:MAG: hypothetical protein R2710_24335 [Acidimicrobiales bacterium]
MPGDAVLADTDTVEIRPRHLRRQRMKCRVCPRPAIIDLRRHNANFCGEHFIKFCHDQVAKAIKDFSMCEPDDRLLVAVSGGKDSLAVWDMRPPWLRSRPASIDPDGEHSRVSGTTSASLPRKRQLRLIEIDLRDAYGYDDARGGRRHQSGCRARPVGCPSDTSSTLRRSTAATTPSSPSTTSTTRRRCSTAT